MTLYPLDFEEFLWASGENLLAQEIRNAFKTMEALPEPLHQKALEFYRCYLIVGGMPASVREFITTGKLVLVPTVQNEIANNYVADMAKYATTAETVKIRGCFNSVPAQLAKENKKFQYKVVQRGGSAAIFGESIEWLAQQTVLTGESNLFMGAVTENYVAQALTSNGHSLFYWASEHSAELDFVLQKESDIIGVEVKRGTKVHSKSLSVFMQKYKPAYAIRFSEKNFGRTENIFSVPLYAVFCV